MRKFPNEITRIKAHFPPFKSAQEEHEEGRGEGAAGRGAPRAPSWDHRAVTDRRLPRREEVLRIRREVKGDREKDGPGSLGEVAVMGGGGQGDYYDNC